MVENGDKEKIRQLERRADNAAEALAAQSLVCQNSRLRLEARLGKMEGSLEIIQQGINLLQAEAKARRIGSVKLAATMITAAAGIVTAVIALIFD